jgi:hypothetical protein
VAVAASATSAVGETLDAVGVGAGAWAVVGAMTTVCSVVARLLLPPQPIRSNTKNTATLRRMATFPFSLIQLSAGEFQHEAERV